MMIIKMQKFVGLIAKNSNNFSFLFTLKMLGIDFLQQEPLFSCRNNLQLLYGTVCCDNPELVLESLSVDHQRVYCLMRKLNSKLFKVCCRFIMTLLKLFVPIFDLCQIFLCNRNGCVDTLKLLSNIIFAVLTLERTLCDVPTVICCLSLFSPSAHSLASRKNCFDVSI